MDGIHGWHAHIYYDPATTRSAAERLRAQIGARFSVVLGRWHDVNVGPHPQAMYQVAFGNEVFSELVAFLALNRAGLAILIHPETGDELADHRDHSMWMGDVLKLNLSVFQKSQ
ncbi:MAG: DOPA 4,5-dioxygenase family protein [Acetobacteraceae bacterium]|nr:DOPA 4,5-dioxygenase family protein [Acetobacteraceae bacterium]